MNERRKKAVIVGAGQTGRGYVARLLAEIGYEITFVDRDAALMERLREDGSFAVHFYDRDRTPVCVEGYRAFVCGEEAASRAVAEADFIFTAVGEQNLFTVAEFLKDGLARRQCPAIVITCENGIHPGKVLGAHFEQLGVERTACTVSQTAVFCSTVHLRETRLDLLSQNEAYFPYDADALADELEIRGATPVRDFEKFLKRKIYTYNCLAGLISYLGFLKGYVLYGDAANDTEIAGLMDDLLRELNPALAAYFGISLAEQTAFSEKALQKFKNRRILDYVVKNGRAPARKLGPTERIVAPLRIIEAAGGDAEILYFNAAAAVWYWEKQIEAGTEPETDIFARLCEILDTTETDAFLRKVRGYLALIHGNRESPYIRPLIGRIAR